ncbi:hypothetical protein [Myxosarcina sp. GI1(2024)]
MTANKFKRAVGTFPTHSRAEKALIELRDAGFNMDRVSAIAKTAEGEAANGEVELKSVGDRAKGGAGLGASMGAATGGFLGIIGSLSILAIPGVGPAVEAGVILGNALLGSGIGATGGGLVGALIGWGIPEEEAKHYQELLSQGSYVIVVEGTEAEVNGAEAILKNRQISNWAVYDATNITPREF